MLIRVIIADDEKLARDVLRYFLSNRKEFEIVAECSSGRQTIAAIHRLKPDLLFLDIQMNDIDGFQVIRQIRPESMPIVVFVTAYDQYAIKAFEVHAVDYLLKPFDPKRFDEAVEHILHEMNSLKSQVVTERIRALLNSQISPNRSSVGKKNYAERIAIKEKGKAYFLNLGSVDWIEAAGDYICFHESGREHLLHGTMHEIEAGLDPSQFIRIHRSCIVNKDRIDELISEEDGGIFVKLTSGERLKVSRSYKKGLQEIFRRKF